MGGKWDTGSKISGRKMTSDLPNYLHRFRERAGVDTSHNHV